MTTNEVLAKYNFITKVPFKSGSNELSKDLKIKIMSMRIEYGKVRKQFDEDLQEFIKGITPEELQTLQSKEEKTEEDNKKINEMIDKMNGEYQDYIKGRGEKEVDLESKSFSEDEFNEIVGVCSFDEVDINNTKVSSADFLEILYSLFV